MKKDQGHRTLQRNDPCRCGSGKKYKNCCWQKDQAALGEAEMDRAAAALQLKLNPIDNPEDNVPLRQRGGTFSQMNRGELFWAALKQGGGKEVPDVPAPLGSEPLELAKVLRPTKKDGKPRPKKKK